MYLASVIIVLHEENRNSVEKWYHRVLANAIWVRDIILHSMFDV